MQWLVNLLTGGVADRLERAFDRYLTAQNDHEKLVHEQRIEALKGLAESEARATQLRLATAGQWEQRFLAFALGAPFALHVVLIGIGTCIAAPLGVAWLEWTLHVPPFPSPFDDAEIGVIGFFFGYATVGRGVSAIAAAIARR